MPKHTSTALVLGGIKGIGKSIAVDLARQGLNVAVTWFDWEESLPELQQDLAAISDQYLIIQCDLCNTGVIGPAVEAVIRRFGGLQILINNIERGGWPVVHGPYTQEQWDLEFATTVRAKRWVFEAALPYLKKSGDGAVINISSIAAVTGRRGPAGLIFNDGYAAANRTVASLTETWAVMGAPEVRVNELMLGFFPSRHGPGTRGWPLLTQQQQEALIAHTPMKRLGNLSDVLAAINFMLWNAPYMTGSQLRLDGGYVIGCSEVPPMPPGIL